MILSKYNMYQKVNGNLIIYNNLSSGVVLIKKEHQDYINYITNNKLELLPLDIQKKLKMGSIIIEDEVSEIQLIRYHHMKNRLQNDSLNLTIAPTSDCNFRCPYCYEKGIKYQYMNEETVNDLLTFIKDRHPKELSIGWYGGEPSLSLDLIELLSDRFIELVGSDKYNASIVSNGYLLDRNAAQMLHDHNVYNVQITLDGPKSYHDKRRIFKDGSGTYERIIENIKNILDLINISIRINVDKTNFHNAAELIYDLEKEGLLDKIRFYIAPINDINGTYKNSACYTQKEYAELETQFYQQFEKYYTMQPPICGFGICGAICENSFVVAPDGYLYKCWDEIGRTELAVGTLKKGITNQINYLKWVAYDIDSYNSECKTCINLPTCYGGCAYQNMKIKNMSHCISFQYNGPKVIDMIYKKHLENNKICEK